jgi:hypothetical protein
LNRTLKDTLERAKGRRITIWGPSEINQDLYERGLNKIKELKSGNFKYKEVDSDFRGKAFNCFHAVIDLYIPEDGPVPTGTARGDSATFFTANHLSPFIIDTGVGRNLDWVLEKLDLKFKRDYHRRLAIRQ